LFIKYKEDFGFNRKGWIDIKPVSEIFTDMESQIDELGREYDYSEKPYFVLCRSGWCDCKYVYRHKTDKDVYCVTNSHGVVVDVTEDHSLYDKDYKEIKPSAITQDTELEYYTNEIHSGNEKICTLLIEETVKSVISGKLDRFPTPFMNLNSEHSKEVIDYWNEHINGEIKFSKTLKAQLQFIYTRVK
jgi:hypothetical protein